MHFKVKPAISTLSIFIFSVGPFYNEIETTSLTSTLWSVISKEKVITDRMNSTADFICLQEVFDKRAAKHLIKGLRKK